jgi:sugar phosphate isomerase/epimerase
MNRKKFLQDIALLTGTSLFLADAWAAEPELKKKDIQLGLVTYLWGKDWDVPTLIKNCSDTKILGVELRVDHAHKVMPDLTTAQRAEVRKQFLDSPVQIVGLGTNEQYDSPDPAKLKASIARTKEFIKLSADVGGTGVKVKPNQFHAGVSHQETLEQIGKSLNDLAIYAKDFGQQIRLEVHGNETQDLPNIKIIMDYAKDSNAAICWNCNQEDLKGEGFEYNFNLVKKRFGDTIHVRELDRTDYPYKALLTNLVKMKYKGWVLLECHTNPADKIKAMHEQRKVFDQMLAAL